MHRERGGYVAGNTMDTKLRNQWEVAALGLAPIHFCAYRILRDVGRMDAKLREADERLCGSSIPDSSSGECRDSLEYHLTLSYLWVLGAYEIVRTVDQACAGQKNSTGLAEVAAKCKEVKRLLERVRIPLAKLEVPRGNRNNAPIAKRNALRNKCEEKTVAVPCFRNGVGVGWQVAPGVFISRRIIAALVITLGKTVSKILKGNPRGRVALSRKPH